MKTLAVKIPESLHIKEQELLMVLAVNLYKSQRITAGQGAEMVNISKRAFLELLGSYGESIISERIEDLESDIENA